MSIPSPLTKGDLDTPALVVDLDVLEANIVRMAQTCRSAGVSWRPHTKGIKVPAIAQMLMRAGAVGVTCAKLGEAEVMAHAGIPNILIANQIVGEQKVARLIQLRREVEVMVAVDSETNVAELDGAASAAGITLGVLLEVDIGNGKAGVTPGEAVVALADKIRRRNYVELRGLIGWEGHTTEIAEAGQKAAAISAAVGALIVSAKGLRDAHHPISIVSCGGTGTYVTTAKIAGVTEIQAGGGIFCDVRYRTKMHVDHPYALTVVTTVTSRPSATRIVCDAGKKTMSNDAAMPMPIGLDNVAAVRLSAEHGTIDLTAPNTELKVGSRLEFVVGYADTTVHLHDLMYAVRKDTVERVWPIEGRGKLQ
jgi:D-serine deaminase-like pyridoxal phosphate-dependent protein